MTKKIVLIFLAGVFCLLSFNYFYVPKAVFGLDCGSLTGGIFSIKKRMFADELYSITSVTPWKSYPEQQLTLKENGVYTTAWGTTLDRTNGTVNGQECLKWSVNTLHMYLNQSFKKKYKF